MNDKDTKRLKALRDKYDTQHDSLFPQECITLLDEILSLETDDANKSNAYYNLSLTYERIGEEDKARESFNKAFELNPRLATMKSTEESVQEIRGVQDFHKTIEDLREKFKGDEKR